LANPLIGKSEETIISALQALLPPLSNCWGRPQQFVQESVPVLTEQLECSPADAGELAVNTYRQVSRLRNMQFRPLGKLTTLDYAYTRLVPTATDSPLRQGYLWLAYQIQKSAVEYLQTEEAQKAMSKLKQAIGENKVLFEGLVAGGEDDRSLTLEKVERIMTTMAEKVFGEDVPGLHPAALVGWAIEFAREEARAPKDHDLLHDSAEHLTEENRQLLALLEPVRKGELNEAYTRFARMNEQQKAKRFDQLRKALGKDIANLAVYAPQGFERFCIAMEALLFPYPASLEWLRSYLKPIYTNAAQSTVFDNCLTEPAVAQRYAKLMEEKSANLVMLELSRAFALAKLNRLESPEIVNFLDKLDLPKQFAWPATLAELKQRMRG